MHYALDNYNREEAARIEAANKATIERQLERAKRLNPVFEAARFTGFSGNMPTNEPMTFDTRIANFEGKTSFSLFIPEKDSDQLAIDREYLVGFSPMMLDEHKSPTAMQFFLNAMTRPSPIMGEFVAAQPVPKGMTVKPPTNA